MAYGNWSAKVYLNGKRFKEREDNTPYKETEYEGGYWQIWVNNIDKSISPVHASLGTLRVRICGYKDNIWIYRNGELLISKKITQFIDKESMCNWERWLEWDAGGTIKGEIDTKKFEATHNGENIIYIKVVEADGDMWEAYCGYHYDDDGNIIDVEKKFKTGKEKVLFKRKDI